MKAAVIGAGLMGSGIVQTCAQSGYQVMNIDVSEEALGKAAASIEGLLAKKVSKLSLIHI